MSQPVGQRAPRRVLLNLGCIRDAGPYAALESLRSRRSGAGTRHCLSCYVLVDRGPVRTQTAANSGPTELALRGLKGGGEMARSVRSTATREAQGTAVAAPRKTRESDWALKIARAKEAREAAKVARKGKRATFSTRLVP